MYNIRPQGYPYGRMLTFVFIIKMVELTIIEYRTNHI